MLLLLRAELMSTVRCQLPTPSCDSQPQRMNEIKLHFTRVMSIFIQREMSFCFICRTSFCFICETSVCITREMPVCITREMSVCITREMSICILREMSFYARETELSQCLNGAFVICRFWCTSISPCQNAKIRKLFIYGFGTCSVIHFFLKFQIFSFCTEAFRKQ